MKLIRLLSSLDSCNAELVIEIAQSRDEITARMDELFTGTHMLMVRSPEFKFDASVNVSKVLISK